MSAPLHNINRGQSLIFCLVLILGKEKGESLKAKEENINKDVKKICLRLNPVVISIDWLP